MEKKKQSPIKRYALILILIALIIALIVLWAMQILTGERLTMIVRIISFLPVLLAGMMLFLEKEGENGKKALTVMLCIGGTAAFALLTRLTPLKGMLSNVFGPDEMLLIPGLDRDGRAVSALLIGIVFGIGLLAATILSIGKQKKGRRMKRRPLDQLIVALLTAVLVILIAVALFLYRGLPLATLIGLIVFIVLKAIPEEKLSVSTATGIALSASICAGIMLGAAL